ncbi:serine/threonine-protein kinase Chk1-like [Lingula anatina]|uniref:Serine/threonine-protein kinase CHK1 n=1 Tax=Lingula anatina TaxID=7574 RepID=A0A1S3IRT1_LINAN|nr:serine/threonine-protein kinase Chk1-like [Lingula anatina]|eukprot:XP_013400239.1 serine/threonine-protein kinase Chk1-like [Lingula anatina]
MVTAFVEGWDFVQTLGEGAYGEVKLAVNTSTQEAVAVKIIDLTKTANVADNVRKEICVHKMMTHESIIKFYGHRKEGDRHYIFLEYASGGELFDRIEPDVGMPAAQGQKFFKQLIAGVEYLHSKGVTHRDLKPENLLLDDDDNLKITDFGLSTVFRHQGKERQLDKCCGTVPYVSPEVIARKPYSAEPADIWSCGIILVTLLAGELPWDEPTYGCQEYSDWKDCKITLSPWNKIDNLALSLLRRVLVENPLKRMTIPQIKAHQWFNKRFKESGGFVLSNSPADGNPFKRFCSGVDLSPPAMKGRDTGKISCSQPEPRRAPSLSPSTSDTNEALRDLHMFSFSQPVHPDHMILGSQMPGTPGASQTPMQRLVRRMTRFFVKTPVDETVKHLVSICEKLGYSVRRNPQGLITLSTMDRRGMNLIFKANLVDMNNLILVDFRLSKGDGLEFKRQFMKIKGKFSSLICKAPLLSSPQAQGSVVHFSLGCSPTLKSSTRKDQKVAPEGKSRKTNEDGKSTSGNAVVSPAENRKDDDKLESNAVNSGTGTVEKAVFKLKEGNHDNKCMKDKTTEGDGNQKRPVDKKTIVKDVKENVQTSKCKRKLTP